MRRLSSAMLAAVFTLLLSCTPALASAGTAEVRFVHAVPGVGTAELAADGQAIGKAGFADATDLVDVGAGPAKLVLTAPKGVELTTEEDLRSGQGYTVVAMATTEGAELRLFRNRNAKADLARVRMIHAAPELGDADLALGGKVIASSASFTDATDYVQVEPGDYRLQVQNPANGDTVLADDVGLAAGTADTALLLGSQGEQTRVVLVQDDVAVPKGAPETGLGGLARSADGGPDFPLAILAAALAGCLGLLTLRLAGRRRLPDSPRQG